MTHYGPEELPGRDPTPDFFPPLGESWSHTNPPVYAEPDRAAPGDRQTRDETEGVMATWRLVTVPPKDTVCGRVTVVDEAGDSVTLSDILYGGEDADSDERTISHLQRIVRSVNLHDELVAVVRDYIEYREGSTGNIDRIADRMKALLKKAEAP